MAQPAVLFNLLLNRVLLTRDACFQSYELLAVHAQSHPHLVQERVVLLLGLLRLQAVEPPSCHVRVARHSLVEAPAQIRHLTSTILVVLGGWQVGGVALLSPVEADLHLERQGLVSAVLA